MNKASDRPRFARAGCPRISETADSRRQLIEVREEFQSVDISTPIAEGKRLASHAPMSRCSAETEITSSSVSLGCERNENKTIVAALLAVTADRGLWTGRFFRGVRSKPSVKDTSQCRSSDCASHPRTIIEIRRTQAVRNESVRSCGCRPVGESTFQNSAVF